MHKKNVDCILILAGRINSISNIFTKYEYLFNIGNSLAIDKILNRISSEKIDKIYVAIPYLDKRFTYLSSLKKIDFIEVGETKGVLESLSNALNYICEKHITVIPITTIPDKLIEKRNACFFSDKSIPKENWSAISSLDISKIKYLYKDDQNSYGINSFPFTGRISAEKDHLITSLHSIKNQDKRDMLKLVKVLIDSFNYQIICEKWFDIGHETTFNQTKLNSINSRFFNNVVYDQKNNSIIKSSSDTNKLSREYYFYKGLSLNFKRYFPHVFSDYGKNKSINKIEIEYIPLPNLAEIFLFKKIGPNGWIRIVSSLRRIYDDFYKNNNFHKFSGSWLYSSKLISRFKETSEIIDSSNNQILKNILHNKTFINKKFKLNSLSSIVKELIKFLEIYELKIDQYIGHGDLCFNNILVDQVSGSIKLIDPKAAYHKNKKIYGLIDPYYDLSKLNHSFKYLYDSIVNNLYSIQFLNNKNLNISIFAPSEYEYANEIFNEYIVRNLINEEILRLLTANLFISMLPLHREDENRMIVFAIVGIMIFQNLEFDQILMKI